MSTPITSIAPLWDSFPSALKQSSVENEGNVFLDVFTSAINNVKETDAEKNHNEYLLATGQLDNPADLTISSSKAELAAELLVQLRNRSLEAYSEIMRINL